MNRALLVACTLLSALCLLQWVTLRRLKADLAVVNYAMAAREFDARGEEIGRAIGWLDADARATAAGAAAGQRAALVCPSEAPNPAATRDLLFDLYVYLRTRAAGVSETDARQRVADSRDQRAHAR